MIGTGLFDITISVPLILEYEDVALRQIGKRIHLTSDDIGNIIDYICLVARHQKIFYLWRPMLKDPKDEFVLEVAVNAGCRVHFNFGARSGVLPSYKREGY